MIFVWTILSAERLTTLAIGVSQAPPGRISSRDARRIADETFTHLTVMRLQSVAENLRVRQSTAAREREFIPP
jgi:hypothetical protein